MPTQQRAEELVVDFRKQYGITAAVVRRPDGNCFIQAIVAGLGPLTVPAMFYDVDVETVVWDDPTWAPHLLDNDEIDRLRSKARVTLPVYISLLTTLEVRSRNWCDGNAAIEKALIAYATKVVYPKGVDSLPDRVAFALKSMYIGTATAEQQAANVCHDVLIYLRLVQRAQDLVDTAGNDEVRKRRTVAAHLILDAVLHAFETDDDEDDGE